MSQAGKVLHLYVEVRSVPEEEGRGRGAGSAHLMLPCPDVLPRSVHSSPDLSPVTAHHTGAGNRSLPTAKSYRHPVSVQPQHPDPPSHVLQDRFDELLQVLAPASSSPLPRGSLHCIPSSDMDPCEKRGLAAPSGRLTVPPPLTSTRRSYEVLGVGAEEGQTSVVTYGYIEKSNVHGGRRSSVSELDGPAPPHLRKRLSDPVRYGGQPGQAEPYPGPPYPSQSRTPQASPRPAPDTVARDATCRALEEFGSPELRRRFGGHVPEVGSPTLPRHYHYPRCRSWAGSPVLPRSTLTLPPRAQVLDRGNYHGSLNGLPRSPASDQLCAHGSPQSPRPSGRFHPPLPAGRPTDIQHEILTGERPGSGECPGSGERPGSRQRSVSSLSDSANTRCGVSRPGCSRASGAVSPSDGRRSVSPSSAEVACQLALEAAKLSSIFADRRTPSPTPSPRSHSPQTGGSFLRESQPYATLHGRLSPEALVPDQQNQQNQWNQQNQHRRSDKSAAPTRPGRISPLSAPSQSPLSERQQQGGSSPSKDVSALHRYQLPQFTGARADRRQYELVSDRRLLSPRGTASTPVRWTSQQQEWRLQSYHSNEVQDHSGAGGSSPSSSGVTGSVSPETCSQSSHDTADTGTQVSPLPSPRLLRLLGSVLIG